MSKTRVAILGVGHLTSHIVPGFMRSPGNYEFVLSQRNSELASKLQAEFDLPIATDNGALVDQADMVLLGTRPMDAVDAVRGLPWRRDHKLVSLCAGVTLADLAPVAKPATIVRAMPIIAAMFGSSPTAIYPDDCDVSRLFSLCGTALALGQESQFDAATAMACHASGLLSLIDKMAEWCMNAGLEADVARRFSAEITRASGDMVIGRSDVSIEELISELTLPGSVTEAALNHLSDADATGAWQGSADLVMSKLNT